jgi:hypothetical protein
MGLPLIAVSYAALAAASAALATAFAIVVVVWSQRAIAASRHRAEELLAAVTTSAPRGRFGPSSSASARASEENRS